MVEKGRAGRRYALFLFVAFLYIEMSLSVTFGLYLYMILA